jgi:HAD superfamily hydrolase (TIGR01509 family)
MSKSRVAAVVFDLDGVLVDTEPVWNAAKHDVVARASGCWRESASMDMLGMSGPEWSEYMRDELAVPLSAREIGRLVVEGVLGRLGGELPLMPDMRRAIKDVAARWPIGLASSADRAVIDAVLEAAEVSSLFAATVSSAEAGRGKPAPDVYLEAVRRLAVPADAAVAIEDSGNGMRSAVAAGMTLIAIPNASTPVEPDALARADLVLGGLGELSPKTIERAAHARRRRISPARTRASTAD